MNNNLLFNFKVDKSTGTVVVEKEFDAELSLVWDAFTKQELLDQWWAPKPFESRTKHMDFKVGGRRFYAMVSPEGQENWQIQDYTSISPKTNFKFFSVFADKDENPFLPGSTWDLTFSEHPDSHRDALPPARSDRSGGDDPAGRGPDGYRGTRVSITIYNESPERMQKMIEMGFKEGFTMTLNELTSLLKTLKKIENE